LNLSSNDYLGLASDPETRRLLQHAADSEPAGATASRLVVGDMPSHREAEARLASYVSHADAVLYPSGYSANTGVIPALVGPGDAVLSDSLNHASLIDAIRLSRATPLIYRHRDAQHAHDVAKTHAARHAVRRWLIVTDSLFSMDADEAPLVELAELARHLSGALLVDEAHSLGVLGPAGRGACALRNVVPDVLVGTLGKAFGLAGAFAACDAHVARWLRNTSRSFVYSTGTLPLLARAIASQVQRVHDAEEGRARIRRHALALRTSLADVGATVLPDTPTGSPIVPWVLGTPHAAIAASAALRERGIFAQPIRPPTVPAGTSRLRLVPTAAHTEADVDHAAEVVREVASFLGRADGVPVR
ncbi:MAG: aminotransferase class I/II-fold pyridoxal phosphate-dependent enzyme, partial [Deltaproteobacteria bacterium]|nr:aminotransferase class I/II-fold pyridoxal phosphate-dependent enzyme [Deltaproteobacteria bacterium]